MVACQQDANCFTHRRKYGSPGVCGTCNATSVKVLQRGARCAACLLDDSSGWFCAGTNCIRELEHARSMRLAAANAASAGAARAGAATAAAVPPQLAQVVAELQPTLAPQQATIAMHEASITQMQARLTATEDKNRQLEGMVQDLQRQNSITEPQVATAAAVAGSSHDWDSSTWAGWSGSGTWDERIGGGE